MRAKIAAVTPLDKGGKEKITVGNYRPVSVLNVFSKFYERIINPILRGGGGKIATTTGFLLITFVLLNILSPNFMTFIIFI